MGPLIRGTQDLLVAVMDGLKGFPEAITSVFPDCVVQTCLVHLIRYSLQFASWKERKPLAKALKAIYSAPSAEAAAVELDRFEAGPYGERFAAVAHSWPPALGGGDPVFRLLARGEKDRLHHQRH